MKDTLFAKRITKLSRMCFNDLDSNNLGMSTLRRTKKSEEEEKRCTAANGRPERRICMISEPFPIESCRIVDW
jgi:hypothetical protein